MKECRTLHGCKTGEAKITKGYQLPAKYIIHTVGPIWSGGKNNESILLANCYKNSLQLAVDNNIETIAFPSISTGVYGYPLDQAPAIALQEIANFLKTNPSMQLVQIVCFDQRTYNTYIKAQRNLNSL